MNIGKAIKTSKAVVTNQTIADLALQADQQRREALRRGHKARAAELQQEIDDLMSQLH